MRKPEVSPRLGFRTWMLAASLLALACLGCATAWDAKAVEFGRPVVVGNLRVTPVSVSYRDLGLRRASTPPDVRSVPLRGKVALVVELENVSARDTFCGDVLSHRVTDDLGNALGTTLTSDDWIVEGSQEHKVLKPGSKARIILGATPAAGAAGSYTWIVRLQVSSDASQEGEIELRFSKEAIAKST